MHRTHQCSEFTVVLSVIDFKHNVLFIRELKPGYIALNFLVVPQPPLGFEDFISGSFIEAIFYDPRGNARDYGKRWHRAGYNGPGGDNGAYANMYAAQNCDIQPNPHIVVNNDWL